MWIFRSAAAFAVIAISAATASPALPTGERSLAKESTKSREAEKTGGETDAFAKIREEWAKNLRAKQLEPLVDLYATDAVFLTPTGERIAGRDAIRELCRKTMAMLTSDITLRSAVTDYSETLAYDSGEFSETLISVADGSKSESHGSYLMVFKKQSDGRWLIVEQVWTGILPPGLDHPAK